MSSKVCWTVAVAMLAIGVWQAAYSLEVFTWWIIGMIQGVIIGGALYVWLKRLA